MCVNVRKCVCAWALLGLIGWSEGERLFMCECVHIQCYSVKCLFLFIFLNLHNAEKSNT